MNVHKLKMDTSGNVEDITLVLAKKNGDKISNLTNITDIVAKHCMNDASELSCEAHKKMDDNVLSCWDELVNFKLSWIPEWDMWYEIYVEIDEKDENTKSITAKTIGEAELSQIMLYDIEINTETDIARDDYKIPTKFYNPDHPEASLVDRLMEKAPHYTITHIDKSLMDIQRTFTFDDTSLYDAFKDISEELDCLFVFNSGSGADGKPARTIQIYDLEANCNDCGYRNTYVDTCPKCGSHNVINGYGEYTNIFISKDNLADDITYSVDTDSVKNCFKLEAGDDLMTAAIRACNPNGSDYIYHFSDQVRHEMSPELQTKLKQYDTEYENYQTNKLFTLDSALVSKYNNIVDKYLKYDDTLAKMDNPMHGYPRVMRAYFDAIDMVQFLSNKLMPNITKPDNSAESQGQYLIDNLPSSASVTSLKTLTVSLAENTIISLARSIVKGSFKITVSDSTLSGNTWRGKINLKGYVNDDDHYTSDYVTIGFDENYQSYVKQRIDTILNKDDTNYYGIVGIFKQDLEVFKSELRKYCLDSLKTFQKCAQGCIDLMVQMGVSAPDTTNNDPNTTAIYNELYIPYYNKINAVQDEILIRQNEIYAVEGEYNNQGELVTTGIQNEIEKIMSSVQKALDFKSYIGVDLYKEFSSFLRMDKFSNENYTSEDLDNTNLFQNALDFINAATKELYKSSTLQHSITGTIKNFLRMKEFEPIMDKFKNGNWITFEVDEKIYQLRIVEYDIDFSDTQNIDVTFSDVVYMPDGMSDLQSVLASATKMATSYSGVLRQSEVNNKFTKKINDMISTGLDMTNTKIISNADHQDITWDEHGLLCREYNDILSDYNPSQLKIINQGIYLTTDNWRTAKAGIGQFWYYDPRDKSYKESYGVIADTLVSNLILTSEVGIYNEENSIEMAKNGIVITTNTNGRNAFTIRKEITDEKGNKSYERQLYIDDNGNIRLSGHASISWDNVTGTDNVVVQDNLNTIIGTLQKEFNNKLTDLEKQDDKKAETWYQESDPSTAWTTSEDKAKHKGDLWYDTSKQVTKIYNGKDWEVTKTTPPDEVFDKIDGKAQIFVSQPKPPYNNGDLWFNSATSDIMTCIKARTTGSFDSTDWEKRNKYTDDSSLTNFLTTTYVTDKSDIQKQIDGKIETFRQETDPSTAWTTAELKKQHIGDLWYDTKNQTSSMYNGKSWETVTSSIPDAVWSQIGSKAQIFTDTPKPEYNKGDLWIVGANGVDANKKYANEILTCTTSKADGTSFSINDWTKQNKYTDDTTANEVKTDLKNLASVLGYNGTTITGTYIYSPHIIGGELAIGDTNGIHASITTDGKLTATGVEISGTITATSGTFTGTVNATSGTFTNVDIQSGNIGGLKLSSNSITSSNLNFSVTSGGKLTAKDADISGNITATSLTLGSGVRIGASKVDGLANVATSGSYDDLSNKPTIPNVEFYIKKDGTIGSTPSDGATGFKVSSDGLLQASNAIIYGTIYASTGTIAGFTYTNTLDSSHCYANSLYSQVSTSDGYVYEHGIKGMANAATEAAFYVRKKKSSESWENSTLPFYVRKNGYVYCENINIGTSLYLTTQNYYKEDDFERERVKVAEAYNGNDTKRIKFGDISNGNYLEADSGGITFYNKSSQSDLCFGLDALYPGLNEVVDLGDPHVYFKTLYINTVNFSDGTSMSTASKGGTSDYGALKSKPKINNVELASGNNTLSDLGIAAKSHSHSGYISKSGTTTSSPVTGTIHMKYNCGWDMTDYNGNEVTGIYCNYSNGTNKVMIADNSYKTIIRGNGIQLGNNSTIINIPYLPNYTSASKYLVADDSGNIGWRSVTQGKTYSLANASTYGVMCLYNSTGSYTDGTMTQKAITEAINNAGGGGGGNSYYAGNGLYLSGSTFNIGYNSRYSANFYEGSNSNHYAFCPTLANNAGDEYRLYLGGNGGSTHPWYKVVTRDGMQQLSDGRFKIDKCILNDDFYDMYMSLKPTKYKVLHDEDSGIHFGFVAQEVEESLKTVGLDASNCSIVSCDESQSYEGGYVYGLSYNEFIPFNTYMTQKAHHRIDSLTQENQKLKNTILSLQGEIAIIKQKLEELA